MKANAKTIMKSQWDIDYMRMSYRPFQRLKSKHTRHAYDKMLKNKWRKEIVRQFKSEISEI